VARHTDALEVAVLNVEQKVLHLLLVVRTCFFFFFFFCERMVRSKGPFGCRRANAGGKKDKARFPQHHAHTPRYATPPRPFGHHSTQQPPHGSRSFTCDLIMGHTVEMEIA